MLTKTNFTKKLNQDDVFGDTWQNQTDEWINYVKNDVFLQLLVTRDTVKNGKNHRIWNEKQFKFTFTRMETFQ